MSYKLLNSVSFSSLNEKNIYESSCVECFRTPLQTDCISPKLIWWSLNPQWRYWKWDPPEVITAVRSAHGLMLLELCWGGFSSSFSTHWSEMSAWPKTDLGTTVTLSFLSCMACLRMLSHVQLFATRWTDCIAHQAPLSMGFPGRVSSSSSSRSSPFRDQTRVSCINR